MSQALPSPAAPRPLVFAIPPVLLAVAVLFGWALEHQALLTILPQFPPMVPASAFLILGTGVGVLSGRQARLSLGVAVMAYATLLSLERSFGLETGVLRLHPFDHGFLAANSNGGMPARTTMTSFVLLGAALVFSGLRHPSRLARVAPGALAAGVATVAWTILLGYLLWASNRGDAEYLAGIALPTGVSLLFLGLAVLQWNWRGLSPADRPGAVRTWMLVAWVALAAYVIDRSLRVPARPVSEGSELLLGGILGVGTATLTAFAFLSAERSRLARDALARANERLREREAALARSEELLRAARDSSLDAFLMLGVVRDHRGVRTDLTILDVNPRVCQLLGVDRHALVGRLLSEAIPEAVQHGFAETWGRVADTGVPVESEVALQRERAPRPSWWQQQVVRTGEGVAVTLREVTEARELEQQFRHSQKIDAIGRLASGVAHDFNNLLAVVLGTTEELLADPAIPAASRADLVTIRQAVERGSELTSRLLAFSRRQPSHRESLAVGPVVADLLQLARRAMPPTHEIRCTGCESGATVLADRGLLEQALMNLLLNARDAMPAGGVIAVTVDTLSIGAPVRYPTGEVGAGEWARIEVRDHGHGMPPEVAEHIFEPFFTTKARGHGAGLGLSTAYGIVRQAEGHIVVAESGGDGTAMHVYLPLGSIGADVMTGGEARTPAGDPPAPSSSERVLVVDDEPEVRSVVARLLRRFGHQVFEAEGGGQALDILSRERITLLVTDMVMPGMGGAELGRLALAGDPTLLVLYISGYTDDAALLDGDGRTRERFLAKPFTAAELVGAMEELLARRAGTAGP